MSSNLCECVVVLGSIYRAIRLCHIPTSTVSELPASLTTSLNLLTTFQSSIASCEPSSSIDVADGGILDFLLQFWPN
jgi:hypothetical protein